MRVVVQRVERASVRVSDIVVSSIDRGLLLLVGIAPADGIEEVRAAVDKIVGLRVFSDDAGNMNLSLGDVGGEILLVSQFTLLGDVRKGRRPSFTRAASPEQAEPLLDLMAEAFSAIGVTIRTGVFGAAMDVESVNEGPVTLVLDVIDGRVG